MLSFSGLGGQQGGGEAAQLQSTSGERGGGRGGVTD